MDIDRETLVEVAISSASVLLMIAAMAFIGMNYSENDADAITPEGGMVFLGAIVVFVFVMLGIGLWFANYKAKQNDDDGGSGDANGV